MTKSYSIRIRAALLAICAVAGCTKPYGVPVVEPKDAEFGTLSDQIERAGGDPLLLIATHGMCSHLHGAVESTNWVNRRAQSIARSVGAPTPKAANFVKRYGAEAPGPGLERWDVTLQPPEGVIQASFLVWGDHVDPHRAELEYENTRAPAEGAPKRASLNHALRSELMNRCMIDAVVYFGRNGDPLRNDMRAAVCDVLGGNYEAGQHPGDPLVPAKCTPTDVPPPKAVALMGESLGSTIMFDAFNGLKQTTDLPSRLEESLPAIRAIYLLSSQEPIISRANARLPGAKTATARAGVADPAPQDGLAGLLDLLQDAGPAAAGARQATIDVVNVTDPNDLLSYRLDPESYRERGMTRFNVVNILVSNAPTLLGLIENPLSAHQGYETNDEVYRALGGRRQR